MLKNVLRYAAFLAGSAVWAATPLPMKPMAYTVVGEAGQAVLRVLTTDATCPAVHWQARTPQQARRMQLRVPAGTLAERAGGAQADHKAAVFAVTTCEAPWLAGAHSARTAGLTIAAPTKKIERMVIVADTGCRMKGSKNAFQACNDADQWPFATVAASAARLRPDLVVHIGDLHYRESPCPADKPGCAGSPWGYGFDAWQADFFTPAKPLLAAAPWVFVRGNHESCQRAGQGWFRFLDHAPWRAGRSCNDPTKDDDADYSDPYAVPIAPGSQLIVFDSSRVAGKPTPAGSVAHARYLSGLLQVDRLASQQPDNFFLSHHPLLAVAPVKQRGAGKPGGSAGLQSVFSNLHPERLLPVAVGTALHGHVHLFEALGFASDHPGTFVLGNSGSANEGFAPDGLASGAEIYPGAVLEHYTARADYGFATLDRGAASGQWTLTEYTVHGQPVLRCAIVSGTIRCKAVDKQ